jgi:CrcB protein
MTNTPGPGPLSWTALMLVGAGGALGSVIRYTIGVLSPKIFGMSLPGTLAANILGAGLAGLLLGLTLRTVPQTGAPWLSETGRLLLITGFCGGLTTFSTLSYEADGLIRLQRWDLSAVYVSVSLLTGLLAVRLGWMLATWGVVRA